MPNLTEHYKLKKQLPDEFYDVAVPNANMDTLDQLLYAAEQLRGYTKAESLDAATKTLLGLNADAVPKDALKMLAGKPDIVFGAYTGDGAGARTILLGFKPKCVLLTTSGGQFYGESTNGTYGGLFGIGQSLTSSDGITAEVVDAGFLVHYKSYKSPVNSMGYVYYYMAIK